MDSGLLNDEPGRKTMYVFPLLVIPAIGADSGTVISCLFKTQQARWVHTLHQVRSWTSLPRKDLADGMGIVATKNIEEICNQIVTHGQLERPDDLRIAVRFPLFHPFPELTPHPLDRSVPRPPASRSYLPDQNPPLYIIHPRNLFLPARPLRLGRRGRPGSRHGRASSDTARTRMADV